MSVYETKPSQACRGRDRRRCAVTLIVPTLLLPALAAAQASPFLTGATALQNNILAWLTPIAVILITCERWAVLSNQALAAAGLQVRIDHRSLRAQGIDREPLPRLPLAAIYMERRGLRSEIAERIREGYRARVQARLAQAARRAAASAQAPDLDAVRRQAREAWLQLRAHAAQPESAQWRPYGKESLQVKPLAPEQSLAQSSPAQHPPAERSRSAVPVERDAADRDFAL